MENADRPHRRHNPLTNEWVLVSPHRALRPWLGQVEKIRPENIPAYDPDCYLCPRNKRSGGILNPDYQGTFVFDNDFPALLPPHGEPGQAEVQARSGLLRAEPASGACRVACFSPRHDLSLPELSDLEVQKVIQTWTEQTIDLGRRADIQYVQVFENKGAMMGASNPHPHSQIWATSFIPNEPAKELGSLLTYRQEKGCCLICDILAEEHRQRERIVAENSCFTAVVPFWAIWPFEILLIANRHIASLQDLTEQETLALANLIRRVTTCYDNLFEISFPYSMGFHQAPTDDMPHAEAHLHMHFYPPLLRSATVRKFLVGFEMLAMPQRDLTPETAAEKLRSLNPVHYRLLNRKEG